MTMTEVYIIRKKYYSSEPIPWIDVKDVIDANSSLSKQRNKRYYEHHELQEENADDEVLVDCLSGHLLQNRRWETINAIALVEAAVYLIQTFWSWAALELAGWGKLLTDQNVNQCMDIIRNAFYLQSEWIPKSLLRNFTVELLLSYEHDMNGESILQYLTDENCSFVQYLFNDRTYTSQSCAK